MGMLMTSIGIYAIDQGMHSHNRLHISETYQKNANAVLFHGSCFDLVATIPDNTVELVVTSPPYNIGKEYEEKITIDDYIAQQREIIAECYRVLSPTGSICWQVGNYVHKGEIIPLDIILYPLFRNHNLKLRNRIIWHFEHGLHCRRRLSGRYETIMWFTKGERYTFNLDPIRVPQKYPTKRYFKGPKIGQYSCNPLGKNPGDLWPIPNVKNNHPEKTEHPCQFPVELIQRLVLSMTNKDDWVFDPFLGVGSSIIAALKHGRKGAGSEVEEKYVRIAKERIVDWQHGRLKSRPMYRAIYDPTQPRVHYGEPHHHLHNGLQKQLFEQEHNCK